MKRMLFNATYIEEMRVAAVDGTKLVNFDIETTSKEQRRGNVYKGVITRVEPSLEACFVDYGTDKHGFLPFREIDFKTVNGDGNYRRDLSQIKEGLEVIVQVEKDERGNKGAAITSNISIPGRYIVLMPTHSKANGISRRIDGEERDELKALMSQLDVPEGMSVILRTAALGRFIEELRWDLSYLLKLWEAILKAADEQKGSFLIYQESSLVIRSIRDHFSPDVDEVLIDTESVYNQARQFMSYVMPNYVDRIKLYKNDIPLFSRFNIEHQIESAYARAVNLPSGGSIVIDHTEALTAVDVNSAKANKGADIEATALATNMEAATEVARQLRLRDLGGLVVVDFIDMENTKNQRELENHFKTELSLDRSRIQISKLSKFGLMELSRQRLQTSLSEHTTITCPRCNGVGNIRGIESNAVHILRIIEEEIMKGNQSIGAIHAQVPVDIATYLLNERRDDVSHIELRMKVKILLIPNVHITSPNYTIKKISKENIDFYATPANSYDLVEMPTETGVDYKSPVKKTENQKSAINLIADLPAAPVVNNGILNRLSTWFAKLFEPKKPVAKSKYQPKTNNNRNRPHNAQGNNKPKDSNFKPNNNKATEGQVKKPVHNNQATKDVVKEKAIVNKPAAKSNNTPEKAVEKQERKNNPRSQQNNRNNQAIKKEVEAVEVAPVITKIEEPIITNVVQVPKEIKEPKVVKEFVATIKNNNEKPVIVEVNESIQPVSKPQKPKPVAKPEILDLGELQMVATSKELINRLPVVNIDVDSNKKRYKDVAKKQVQLPDVEYQLVETK